MTRDLIFREIADIDRKASLIVEGLGSPADRMVISAIQLFQVGGGAWQQLGGRDRSQMMIGVLKEKQKSWKRVSNPRQQRLLDELTGLLSRSTEPKEAALLQELIDLVSRKARLVKQLLNDIRLQGLMEIWLYCHIPLTLALLATLTAHIVSVFFYW
jgi:mevalonate kinase